MFVQNSKLDVETSQVNGVRLDAQDYHDSIELKLIVVRLEIPKL